MSGKRCVMKKDEGSGGLDVSCGVSGVEGLWGCRGARGGGKVS